MKQQLAIANDEQAAGLDPRSLHDMNQAQMIELVCQLHRKVVVRQTERGPMQGVVQVVPMRVDYEMLQLRNEAGEPVGLPFINASGYNLLANRAGFSIKTPRSVVVDGEEMGNPAVVRDENGRITSVYVRKIVVGRNSSGNLVARDQTVIFNPWAYLLEELHHKELHHPKAIMGAVLDKNRPAFEAGYAFYPEIDLGFGQVQGMNVAAADPIVRSALNNYIGRIKKCVEIAQTFADRNALRKVLGVPESPTVFNGVAYVTIMSWQQPDTSWRAVNDAIAELDGGTGIDGIQLEVSVDEMDSTDAAVTTAETVSTGDAATAGGDAPAAAAAEIAAADRTASVPVAQVQRVVAQVQRVEDITGEHLEDVTTAVPAEFTPNKDTSKEQPGGEDPGEEGALQAGDGTKTPSPSPEPAGPSYEDDPLGWVRAARRQLKVHEDAGVDLATICEEMGIDGPVHRQSREVIAQVLAAAAGKGKRS